MLISADWVLPISRRPIRDGAVIIEAGRVVEVGPLREIEGLARDGERRHFEGCAIMPGLVNAHTHLSLTALEGLLPSLPFAEWLSLIVKAMPALGHDGMEKSASLGVLRCLQAGVTVVGDIAYGPEAPAAAADAGLGGFFAWEVLGITPDELPAVLDRLEYPAAGAGRFSGRVRCGLSPHAPYTSGPELLQAVHDAAREFQVPFAIHVAESAAEVELMRSGTGPLAPVAERLAKGFSAPGTGVLAYLDRLGVLDGATAVHLCHLLPVDLPRVASTVRGAVTCPRSNAYLHNPVANVERLLARGIAVGVGTDSAASNHDLDLMEEVRSLHRHFPDVPYGTLLEMVTSMGAVAIGMEDRFGILENGMQGDLAIFRVGATDEPERELVLKAGAATLEATMSAGGWRVLAGKPVLPPAGIEHAAMDAARRAAKALGVG